VPVEHPQLAEPGERLRTAEAGRDEYPLLSLPEQKRSRQSLQASSLVVERSSGDYSGRTSIKLPENRRSQDRRSQHFEQPPDFSEAGPGPATEAARAVAVGRQMESKVENGSGGDLASKDLEAGRPQVIRRTTSRASLPLSRHGEPQDIERAESGVEEEEFTWGPSHPCYPHPNPHVPLDSPLYQTTRIIRIGRDWMQKGDLAPTFNNVYPEILDPHITEEEFRKIIKHINTELIDAFSPWSVRAWADAILGVATFWLWEDLGLAGVKSKLEKLEKWISNWNRDVGSTEAVVIMPLRRTGYLSVSSFRFCMKSIIREYHR
jgi:hypothetical protein